MKKMIIALVTMMLLGTIITGCGSSAEDLLGTWHTVDGETGEVSPEEGISFYNDGKMSWDTDGFLDEAGSPGYIVTGSEIQFTDYGNVEATAEFVIKGNRLELKIKEKNNNEEKILIFEKD